VRLYVLAARLLKRENLAAVKATFGKEKFSIRIFLKCDKYDWFFQIIATYLRFRDSRRTEMWLLPRNPYCSSITQIRMFSNLPK
jgi:hypothetical protein